LAGAYAGYSWAGYHAAAAYLLLPALLAAFLLPLWAAIGISFLSSLLILTRSSELPNLVAGTATLVLFLGVLAAILAHDLRDAIFHAWRDAELGVNLTREMRARQEEVNRLNKMLHEANYLLKRSNHELAMARLEAEEARHAKERFAASISHELRTPLNIILGFAEIMQRFPEVYGDAEWPALLRHDIAEMQRSARYLSDLVDDILDLARVEALRLPIRREWVELRDLLLDSADVARRLVASKPVEVRVDCCDSLPALFIDRTRIRQVLLNLLANASRFTAEGAIVLHTELGDEEVQISVSDTGSGMPPERLEHIFEEFQQEADLGPSLGGRQGKGLGLTIAKHFVQLHGGRIWVESKLGIGTCFSFTLPLQAKQVAPSVLPDMAALPHAPDGGIGLVIIDQEPSASAYLSRWLEGVTVWRVADLPEAKALVHARHPAAVLVNVPAEPQFDTYVGSVVSELASLVPVIRCTLPFGGWLLDDQLFEAWLVKPLSVAALSEALGRVGDWHKVLIVDDDRGFSQLLTRMLHAIRENCEVSWASTAQQALARLAKGTWDIMLVDISLPDMDGRRLAQLVRDGSDGDSSANVRHVLALSGLQPGEGRSQPAGSLFAVHKRGGLRESELLAMLSSALRSIGSTALAETPLPAPRSTASERLV